jgi:hypothetical protein
MSEMALHPSKLTAPLLLMAMVVLALSAGAQSSDRAIIFSTPKSDDTQATAPSLTPQNSLSPILPDSLQAPDPMLHPQAPNDIPVAPPPAISPLQAQRMKKMLDDRKNWSQMTPEEILGTTPTDELLQTPEKDTMGRNKNMSPLDRYFEQQNSLNPRGGVTNNWQAGRNDSPWNFSRNRENSPGTLVSGRDGLIDAAQRLNDFLNGRRMGDGSANRDTKIFGWDAFSPPASQIPDKPDVEQAAAMDRFRQLLNPTPVPATEPSADSKYFAVPATSPAPDPNFTQPDYIPNPAGASYTPVTSGLGKPAGLTPLPGVATPAIVPATVPAWAPQPAPWLNQGPQLFVMPQRKF